MNLPDISNIRLACQKISGAKLNSPKEIVGWMGAMQAQDYKMAKWAIGIRSTSCTEKSIDAAIDSGEIIRTHILRPTWHFVSADDIYWMLELTAPRIKAFMKSSNKLLGLTDDILKKSNTVIKKALKGQHHLTRTEILKELNKHKIATDINRSSHILINAELDGIICSGATKNNQTTYALLNERVVQKNKITKEQALGKLVVKYFESHCPATLADFIWWSGLSVNDAKHAFEIISSDFISEQVGEHTYWFPNSFSLPENDKKSSAYLLPAYDEFLISYKNRTAAIVAEHHPKAFSNNGIFWPTIVINGQVKGTWKRTIKKNKIILETKFFERPGKNTASAMKKASEKFNYFLGHEIQIVHQSFMLND
jgi:Winged helix DNA-binding domain